MSYGVSFAGFTKHPSSGVDLTKRGTYAGLIDKIPYLLLLIVKDRWRGWGGRVPSLYLLGGVRPDTFEEIDGWICLEEGLTSLRSWPE